MSIPSSSRALLATAAIALLSACSGASQLASSSLPANGAPQSAYTQPIDALHMSPDAKVKDFVFASDNGGGAGGTGVAYEYNRTGSDQSPLETLTTSVHYPFGMYIGAAPNPDLYVSNEGSSNVLVYGAPSYSAVTFTYNDPSQLPSSVAQCGNYVYAGNVLNTQGTIGSATAWNLGTATPITTVSSQNYVNVTGIACDFKTGNVYVAFLYSYAGPGGIDQYAPGLAGKPTTLAALPAFPAGIAVEKNGDIAVCEALAGTVEFYSPKKAKPVKTVTGFVAPQQVAFEKPDSIMWVADQGKESLYRVSIKTGKKMDTITKPGFNSLVGTATVPADH